MHPFIVKFFATGLGAGYAPIAPGSLGSLLGAVIYYLWRPANLESALVFVIPAVAVAVWIAHKAEKIFAEKDCQKIVVDEVVGQWITYLFAPFAMKYLLAGFVLFRVFDIMKLPPARWVQDKIPGGAGIVGDDVVAGIQAGVVLWFVTTLL